MPLAEETNTTDVTCTLNSGMKVTFVVVTDPGPTNG